MSNPPTSINPTQPTHKPGGGGFAPGNKCAKGNPFAKKVAQLRAALMAAVSIEDIQECVLQLMGMVKKGNVQAITLLFDRVLGKTDAADMSEQVAELEGKVNELMAKLAERDGVSLPKPTQLSITA